MSSEEAAAETKPEAETTPTEDVKTSEDVDKAAEALEKVGVAGESRPDPALFLFSLGFVANVVRLPAPPSSLRPRSSPKLTETLPSTRRE